MGMGFFEKNTSGIDKTRAKIRAQAKAEGRKLTRAQEASAMAKALGYIGSQVK